MDRLSKIKIITDSTSDIPAKFIEELDITVVPLKVHFGEKTYVDGKDLTAQQFYQKLDQEEVLPTTSQPSPVHFQEAYHQAIDEGYSGIISIHLSSALSGTFQSAQLAKEMVDSDKVLIELIDSRTATYAIGNIVVAAARAAKAGKSLDECLAVAKEVRKKQVLLAYVDTLEYLHKGGRIGKAAALMGSLLKIKPIISLDDEGEVYSIEKARGKKKAVRRIFELIEERVPPGSRVSVAILHGTLKNEAEEWLARLKEKYQVQESLFAWIGPIVGTHAGPHSIGMLVTPMDEK